MGVYLVPARPENLEATIHKPVPSERLKPLLTQSKFRKINSAISEQGFHLWAMTEGSRPFFEKMSAGDQVLFYPTGTGVFTQYGVVIDKVENSDIGKTLWPVGCDWNLVYFLKGVRQVNIAKSELLARFDYDRAYRVPGVVRVADWRVQLYRDRYGNIPASLGIG